MDIDRETLLVVLIVAALGPLVADLPARVRVPGVVVEILLGIVVGPQVLDLARPDELVEALSEFGLAFLFFMAGMEIDLERLRGAPLRLAARGWALSLALGMVVAAALYATGVVGAPVLVGLTLTTTALGALVPILKDAGLTEGRFGLRVLGAGAAGEFGPIVALSIVLAIDSGDIGAHAAAARVRRGGDRDRAGRDPLAARARGAAGGGDDARQRAARAAAGDPAARRAGGPRRVARPRRRARRVQRGPDRRASSPAARPPTTSTSSSTASATGS